MNRSRLKIVLAAALIGAAAGARVAIHQTPLLEFDPAVHPYRGFLIAAVASWCLFSLYWEAAAKTAAPARSSESPASRAIHVTLVNLAAVMILLPIRGFGRFLPATPLVMSAGLLVEALGILLAVWSRRHLGRNWSGAIQIKLNPELVRSGPYSRLRHPIYVGLLLMYAGTAIVTGEWLGAAGLALAIAAYWRKIRLEEAALHTAFGAAYEQYARETW
jgi:protein-S-isoprenylcysteine O-methyltransferase Ste14